MTIGDTPTTKNDGGFLDEDLPPAARGHRALRPPLRRLRPRPGTDRGRVGQGDPGEVPGNDDVSFRARAIEIKEQRSDLVKHHLWVLWTDYFKPPPHFEKYPPELHELFNKATKAAGASGTKGSNDPPKTGQELLDYIAQIDKIFWETKKV